MAQPLPPQKYLHFVSIESPANNFAYFCGKNRLCHDRTNRKQTLGCRSAEHRLRNNIPFYTYRLPGSREVIFGAQLSNDTRIFKGFEKHRGEKGFVITPFNHSSWSFPFFIKADLSFTDYLTDGEAIRNLQNTVFNTPERIFTKQDCEHFEYLDELRTMIDTLKQEGMKKAVLSRTITIPCDSLRLSPAIFEQMKQYHHAFLFFAAIPGKCAWMGASPETFLKYDRNGFFTMSLAGSQPVATAKNHMNGETRTSRNSKS